MKQQNFVLTAGVLFVLAGCGSSSTSSSGGLIGVRVSDAYVVNAQVKVGAALLTEASSQGAGYYTGYATHDIVEVSEGVNDMNQNGIPDEGEPFTPILNAPSGYHNVTPFTTVLIETDSNFTKMNQLYPHASVYRSDFDFDVVVASQNSLEISKENSKAAIELSYEQAGYAPQLRIINGSEVSDEDQT